MHSKQAVNKLWWRQTKTRPPTYLHSLIPGMIRMKETAMIPNANRNPISTWVTICLWLQGSCCSGSEEIILNNFVQVYSCLLPLRHCSVLNFVKTVDVATDYAVSILSFIGLHSSSALTIAEYQRHTIAPSSQYHTSLYSPSLMTRSLLLAPVNCLQLSNCLHTVAIDHSLLLLLLTHNNSSSIWTAAQPSSDSLPIIWHTITTFSFSSYGLHSPSCLFTHHN